MSDVIGPIEVERDVSTGVHMVTVYTHGVAHELTAFEAQDLAGALRSHAEPATCWQCGDQPSMPGDLCPRCEEASDR